MVCVCARGPLTAQHHVIPTPFPPFSFFIYLLLWENKSARKHSRVTWPNQHRISIVTSGENEDLFCQPGRAERIDERQTRKSNETIDGNAKEIKCPLLLVAARSRTRSRFPYIQQGVELQNVICNRWPLYVGASFWFGASKSSSRPAVYWYSRRGVQQRERLIRKQKI